jgi:hypothetical protein
LFNISKTVLAATAPRSWAPTYGRKSAVDKDLLSAIITDTAGFRCADETGPATTIAARRPITIITGVRAGARAFLAVAAKITERKKKVPRNSATYFIILYIYLD